MDKPDVVGRAEKAIDEIRLRGDTDIAQAK